jgi:hypothetical protein
MKFEEALVELRKGKKVRCKDYRLSIKKTLDNYIEFEEYGHSLSHVELINIIFSIQWEVVEEPGKTFPEVFEAFKEGKTIKRKEWINDISIFQKDLKNHVDYLLAKDLLATDWQVIE